MRVRFALGLALSMVGGPSLADDARCRCLAGTREDEGPQMHMSVVTNALACIGTQSSDAAAPRCRIEVECLRFGGGPRCPQAQAVATILVRQRNEAPALEAADVETFRQTLEAAYAEHLQQTGNPHDLPSSLLSDLHATWPDLLSTCLASAGKDPALIQPADGFEGSCGKHPDGMWVLVVPGRPLQAAFQIATDG